LFLLFAFLFVVVVIGVVGKTYPDVLFDISIFGCRIFFVEIFFCCLIIFFVMSV